jgi:hypothetical protein
MNVVQFVITERDERLTALAECLGSKGVSIKGDPDRVDVHVTIDGERTEVLKARRVLRPELARLPGLALHADLTILAKLASALARARAAPLAA